MILLPLVREPEAQPCVMKAQGNGNMNGVWVEHTVRTLSVWDFHPIPVLGEYFKGANVVEQLLRGVPIALFPVIMLGVMVELTELVLIQRSQAMPSVMRMKKMLVQILLLREILLARPVLPMPVRVLLSQMGPNVLFPKIPQVIVREPRL